MIYLRSAVEVVRDYGGIAAESAVECFYDARKWLGRAIVGQLDKMDQAACNALNRSEDES